MRCAGILVVLALAIGCAPGRAARRQGTPLRHTGSELIHGSGLGAQDQNIRQSLPAAIPDPPAAACESSPEFSYDLYSDKQGHFSHDGAALALVKRPSHLQRVYADAARGDARPKSLVLELEYWFQQAGIAVADRTAALGCRVLPELQPDCRPPNWEFIEEFLGDSPECVRLREVLAEAYARRAYQLGVRNDVTVAGVNLLLAGSLAQAVLARVGVVEARTAARQTLASEAKAAKVNPLEGTTYTDKVRAQMRPNLKTGRPDNHGFPLEVDNSAGQGRQTTIKGSDGVSRTKIELDGSYNGQQGTFEWIIEPNGTVNHRLFVPKPGGAP